MNLECTLDLGLNLAIHAYQTKTHVGLERFNLTILACQLKIHIGHAILVIST